MTPAAGEPAARELMLLGARAPAPASIHARAAVAAESIHAWDVLLETARAHKVVPLLHHALCAGGAVLPRQVCASLDRHVRALRLDHRFMSAELERVVDLLAGAASPVIVFKGLVLEAMAFAPFGATREYGDIDLLVDPRDFAAAKRLLLHNGYRMVHGIEHERSVGQAQLVREDGRVNVDLHRRVAPYRFPGAPSGEALRQRVVRFRLGTRTVSTFDPDATLLITCLQGAKERWSWLSRVSDVAWLIAARADCRWEGLTAFAERSGARRVLLLGLVLAHRLLAAPVPGHLLAAAEADRSLRTLAARAETGLRGGAPSAGALLNERQRYHYHLREGWLQRGRYLASVLPSIIGSAIAPRRLLHAAARASSRPQRR